MLKFEVDGEKKTQSAREIRISLGDGRVIAISADEAPGAVPGIVISHGVDTPGKASPLAVYPLAANMVAIRLASNRQ